MRRTIRVVRMILPGVSPIIAGWLMQKPLSRWGSRPSGAHVFLLIGCKTHSAGARPQ